MSTAKELAEKNGFTLACGDGLRQVQGVYCCDLLSIVMGRAPADSAWVTVMGNLNSIAVAVLADMSCVIAAEGVKFPPDAVAKAQSEDLALLECDKSAYEICSIMARAGIQ